MTLEQEYHTERHPSGDTIIVPSIARQQWLGGKNPAGSRYVTVKFRDQRIKTVPADQVDWLHDPRDPDNDVVFWDFD